MKNMHKVLALVLALCLILALTACGGEKYEETFVGTYAAAYGLALPLDSVIDDGFDITLKDGGKCTITISGKDYSGKWTNDNGAITITAGGETFEGEIDTGIIILHDVMGQSVDILFLNDNFTGDALKDYINLDDFASILG